jgi:protein-S-isoprenylcysteine O-methyltransferase Ste14
MPRTKPFRQKIRIAALWLLGIAALWLAVTVQPALSAQSLAGVLVRVAGAILLFAALTGRMWAILYVGPVKNRELVQTGPYSIVRNPLYAFSLLGIAGTGLALGSILLAIGYAGVFGLVFWLTAREEARFLAHKFGADYDAYAARVPLFLPRPSLFQAPESQSFSTKALRRTFLDGLVFVAIIPLAAVLDWVKPISGLNTFTLF